MSVMRKAAYPALEQAALNFLSVIADSVITGIENGTIPLPALAADPAVSVDPLALGRTKQAAAFNAIQAHLTANPPPEGIKINTSLINSAIEIAVAKKNQIGNQGNGGTTGNFAEKKDA